MPRKPIWNTCLAHLCNVCTMIVLILLKTSLTQQFAADTACTRSTDPHTKVETTYVEYTHRFQVTATLHEYPFVDQLADIHSALFTTVATRFENEVTKELRRYETRNMYQAVVFLFIPFGFTTQIVCVVSAAETTLKDVDVLEVMRRLTALTNLTEFQNLKATVHDEVKYCLREIIVPPNGTLTWPTTPIETQTNTVEICPEGTEFAKKGLSLGKRRCLQTDCKKNNQEPTRQVCHGAWQPFQCNDCGNVSVNAVLQLLSKMTTAPNANALTLCQQALDLTSTAEGLSEIGVESIAVIAQFISSVTPVLQQHLQCVTQLTGNILLLSKDTIKNTELDDMAATRLHMSLDKILFSAEVEIEQLVIVTTDLAVGLINTDPMIHGNQWYGFGSIVNDGLLLERTVTLDVSLQPVWTGQKDTYVYVLADEKETSSRAVFTLHQNDKFYQQLSEPNVNGFYRTQLNSRIISANTDSSSESQPTLYVAFKMIDSSGTNQTCVTWVNSADGIFGYWSDQGCFIASMTQDRLTICQCDRYGSFALLAKFQFRPLPEVTQPPIPINGFVIFAAVFSFLAFSAVALVLGLLLSLRIQRELQILTIMFFNLAAFYLIIAIVINRPGTKEGCVIGASLAYFFLMATFAWMVVASCNLYDYSRQNYIQLKWFVRKSSLLAFGIPGGLALILIVTNPYYFFQTQYICFISGSSTTIIGTALILPMAITTVTSMLLLIASFVNFPELETLGTDLPKPRIQRLVVRKKRMRMTATVFCVISVTVVFLFIALYKNSIALQVLFGLVAVAQGVYVVWVYCYNDHEIKTGIIDALKNTKSHENEPAQSYWSRSQGLPEPDISEDPNRFHDNMNRSTPMILQSFHPNSVPMTVLEKKRLSQVIENGDIIREAVIMSNPISQAEVMVHNTEVDRTKVGTNGTCVVDNDANWNEIVHHAEVIHTNDAENLD